ncbi:FtsX-like permease family protein [Xylanimonas allomyrinae]|uniref:FtsX-like permease family protein n=1 Tax=Xylanimonas allomyrinae TaxID=2509459 RepID=UPI001FE8A68B|nr:ABC transporter permease [Xylanimonas allomyrinae]
MLRIALRGISAHLVRFLMSLLAVALGVAFMAGTLSLRTMLSTTFDGIVEAGANADAFVRGSQEAASANPMDFAGSSRNTVDTSLVSRIDAVDGVRVAIPELSAPVVLVGKDGTAVQSTQAPSFATGIGPDDPTATLLAGHAPRGPDEIALEEATLEASGLAVGDTTRLVVDGEVRTVTVVGEMSLGGPMAGATIVLIDRAVAAAQFAPDGRVPTIAVYADPGVSEQELVERVAPVLEGAPTPSEVVRGQQLRDETRADIDEMLGFMTTFLVVFAAIALFVGGFIIANTFSMAVRQRVREFALLRAVGASPRQVFASIVLQAAVVGLLGSAIGVLAGFGLVELARAGLEAVGMDLAGEVPVTVTTVVVCVVIGVVVSVVAAALPARRAAVVPPVEAMRDEVSTSDRTSRWRVVVGLVLAVGGAALVVGAGVRPDADGAGPALGVGAAGVLFGALALGPWLARVVVGALGAPVAALARPVGGLARGNATRNPKRTAATAGALMIGMALVGAASVLAASANASVASAVEAEAHADLVLRGPNMGTIPAGALADVAALDAVGRVDPDWWSGVLVTSGEQTPSAADMALVMGLEPGVLGGRCGPR